MLLIKLTNIRLFYELTIDNINQIFYGARLYDLQLKLDGTMWQIQHIHNFKL